MASKQNGPLITVGIPTYNGGDHIKKAINSVLIQSYKNVEILIADNASAPETQKICEDLAQHHACITHYRHDKNIGMFPNFHFLLQKATGKYFMWVADDDALTSDSLLEYVQFLENHAEYNLVSGTIIYWKNGHIVDNEKGFNFHYHNRMQRVLGYYYKVVHGAMYHGLMRTAVAQQIPLRSVIGGDWHFVATLAFLGKIRNLPFVGYHKTFGGSSNDFKSYARVIGETEFAGRHPHLKIAIDAFQEVTKRSPVYARLSLPKRVFLGSAAALIIIYSYFVKLYPFILGGKIKRALFSLFGRKQYSATVRG